MLLLRSCTAVCMLFNDGVRHTKTLEFDMQTHYSLRPNKVMLI